MKSTKNEGFGEFKFFHDIGGSHIAYVLISVFEFLYRISGDISPWIKHVGTRNFASSIRTASKVSDEGWRQKLHAGGGKECS